MMELLKPIPWESRNLQRPAFEIETAGLDAADATTQLRKAIAEAGRCFVQGRIGKSAWGRIPAVQDAGLYFAEMTLHPYTPVAKNSALKQFKDDPSSFAPRKYNDLSLLRVDPLNDTHMKLLNEMAAASFTDDRFHLDPNCSTEIADQRYVLWINDMLASGGTVFDFLRLSGEPVGFMARKRNNLQLAGFLPAHAGKGLGDYLWLSCMTQIEQEGHAAVDTTISAGNVSVLNLYARLGFKFRDPEAVLHGWFE